MSWQLCACAKVLTLTGLRGRFLFFSFLFLGMTTSARSHLSRFSLYLDLIRWNRPAGWLVLMWPTLSALWLAAGGFPGWHLLAVFVLGRIGVLTA